MAVTIDTERLTIRSFEPRDLDCYAALVADRDVMVHLGGTLSRGAAKAYIERALDNECTLGFGRYAVVLKSSGECIGMCGFAPIKGYVDLGYRFAKTHWGHGFATESARAVIAYGFEVHGFDEIVATALKDNHASLRVIRKLGFKFVCDELTDRGEPSLRHVLRDTRSVE